MRIVGYCEAAVLLGLGLAAANFTQAAAQTTVVGGDGRPAVTVDRSVLDSLGPTPTLPDLLLGKQPSNPPRTAVKLHRPTGKPAIAAIKPATSSKSKAVASSAPKAPKPAKTVTAKAAPKPAAKAMAKVEPKPKSTSAKSEIKVAGEPTTPALEAARKKLASNFDVPPAPPKLAPGAGANADVPGGMVESTPAPTPAPTKAAQAAPTPSKSLTPSAPAPQKLAAAEPAPTPAPAAPAASNAAPAAPPAPAAKAEPASSQSKIALLTPPPTNTTTADGGTQVTIPFAKDGASLSDDARGALGSVAKSALADAAIQIQVLAYASGDEDNASKARRLSLSRALAVRSYLIDQGVHSTRIEVRALGNKVPEGPADRVDLVEQKH
ncbi:MAG TPA: OmpA family protein [Magnetospirillaceae bacterium]